MAFDIDYSEEKNSILKITRGFGFEDIEEAIKSGNLIDNQANPNFKKYPKQRIYIVKIKNYIYAVPYVIDEKRKVHFLKTFYPSRRLTKKYLNEK